MKSLQWIKPYFDFLFLFRLDIYATTVRNYMDELFLEFLQLIIEVESNIDWLFGLIDNTYNFGNILTQLD